MSSIPSGMGNPLIPSSIAGSSSSEKTSSTERTQKADGGAAKTVQNANSKTRGLTGSEKSDDRDADGRQLYEPDEERVQQDGAEEEPATDPLPRSNDPKTKRGNRLDLDA